MSETDNQDKPELVIGLPNRRIGNAQVREAAVSTAAASKNPCACPVCGCKSVAVEGQFRREFAEEFVDGESRGFELNKTMEKNVLAVICPTCRVRYVIEPDVVFKLREELVQLHMELASGQGLATVPVDSSLVN